MIEKKQKINKITKNSEKSKIDKYLGKLRKKLLNSGMRGG